MDQHQLEIERNYSRFREILPQILAEHRGQYALMREGEIVQYFPTAQLADLAGMQQYGESGSYSVQEVSEVVQQSGAFVHATV